MSAFLTAMRDAMAPGVYPGGLRRLVAEPGDAEEIIGLRWTMCEAFRRGHRDTLASTQALREYAREVADGLGLSTEEKEAELKKLFVI